MLKVIEDKDTLKFSDGVTLNKEQTLAVKNLSFWYLVGNTNKQYKIVHGYAGTGKTFFLKYLLSYIECNMGGDNNKLNVAYAAFTGNASMNLLMNGNKPSSTIHSLIYTPSIKFEEKERVKVVDGKKVTEKYIVKVVKFYLNDKDKLSDKDLLIIDEYSMINDKMIEEILSFGIKTIFIGDPGQLTPVTGVNTYIDKEPDVLLLEQKRSNNRGVQILYNDARNKIALPYTISTKYPTLNYGKNINIYPLNNIEDLEPSLLSNSDVVVVATNKDRVLVNNIIRKERGYKKVLPEIGEKLICLENTFDTKAYSPKLKSYISLVNGLTVVLTKILKIDEREGIMICNLTSTDDDECIFQRVPISFKNFKSKDKKVKKKQIKKEGEVIEYCEYTGIEFDYGYALTCHKAQGHGYENVVVLANLNIFNKKGLEPIESRKTKWLYTAITRCKSNITLLIPDDFYFNRNYYDKRIYKGNYDFDKRYYFDIYLETFGYVPEFTEDSDFKLKHNEEGLKPWERKITKETT